MGNYIKIDRRILEWEWYTNINTCRIFLHLLIKANWKDGRFQGKEVPRGSLVSSISKLSEETGLTPDEVRTALKHLKSSGEITSKSHSKFTVITIEKYSVYQDIPEQIPNVSQADPEQIPGTSHSIPILFPTIEEGKKEKQGSKEAGKQESKEAGKQKDSPRGGAGQMDLDALLKLDSFQGLADNEPLVATVKDWLQYKAERKDAYKPSGLKSLIAKIQKEAAVYGSEVMIELIEESMANQWRGIIWERAEKLAKGKAPVVQAGGQNRTGKMLEESYVMMDDWARGGN